MNLHIDHVQWSEKMEFRILTSLFQPSLLLQELRGHSLNFQKAKNLYNNDMVLIQVTSNFHPIAKTTCQLLCSCCGIWNIFAYYPWHAGGKDWNPQKLVYGIHLITLLSMGILISQLIQTWAQFRLHGVTKAWERCHLLWVALKGKGAIWKWTKRTVYVIPPDFFNTKTCSERERETCTKKGLTKVLRYRN